MHEGMVGVQAGVHEEDMWAWQADVREGGWV